MNELRSVGIDVSKAKLDVCCFYADDHNRHEVYTNDAAGLAALIGALGQQRSTYKIVLESTGRYHLLAALTLSEAGCDVRVINPLLAKRYTRSSIRKVKTDKADARVLAQVAWQEQNLSAPFARDKRSLQLKQKMGLLASLEKQVQALSASLNAYAEYQQNLAVQASKAEQNLHTLVTTFRKQIKQLEHEIVELALSDEQTAKRQRLLKTVPGFSASVAALLAELLDTHCTHPKQWIAYLGMDISVRQSGTWFGRGRVTKRGNPYLRKRLYGAAWGAVMNYPEVKTYYLKLKQAGRKHVEALLIIARKLLRIAFSLLKHDAPYDPECAFTY